MPALLGDRPRLDQHADALFQEKRVPTRSQHEVTDQVGWEVRPEDVLREGARAVLVERAQLERREDGPEPSVA
jgi:hypothetical protein